VDRCLRCGSDALQVDSSRCAASLSLTPTGTQPAMTESDHKGPDIISEADR
jgi:hypothetical protein